MTFCIKQDFHFGAIVHVPPNLLLWSKTNGRKDTRCNLLGFHSRSISHNDGVRNYGTSVVFPKNVGRFLVTKSVLFPKNLGRFLGQFVGIMSYPRSKMENAS